MNKRQKETAQAQLDSEKAVLNELKEQYQHALDDINRNIQILQSDELTQSKIYQIEYQKALRGQVSAILDQLQGNEFQTIQDYLNNCYTTAFVGTMYDLHGQGAPVIIPIDQKAAVKAIMTDSQISGGLYSSLGVDVSKLKKSISREITRGIATGLTYGDIARNISSVSKAPLARAKTIARTEGHRIQQASTNDAQKLAKSKGADVVKQWDSTLDGLTREIHRLLDGQIREVDDPFEASGRKAMFPGDFGDPAEDCNCRCVVLTRARKALDADELATLKERAEFFGLDKTKDFEEFEKSYLKAAETIENSDNVGIIKSIKVDDIKAAVKGGTIKEDVAVKIYDVLNAHKASYLFNKATTKNLGNSIVFQTDPQKLGTFFDTVLVMNEDILGGKTVDEISAIFKSAKNTVANSIDDAVIHEMYHSKLIQGLNYAQLENLYDELKDVHIAGLSKTAYIDGTECIAETGVLIERGETENVPEAALALFERFFSET